MQDLPDFIPPLFGQLKSLPAELANEPYSFHDDKLRPEIVRKRCLFHYQIRDSDVICYVGDRTTSWGDGERYSENGRVPDKTSSNVSVVAVYDRYGIPGAYTYLKHLYERKYNESYPAWLYIYLEGSLMVLRPDYTTTHERRDEGVSYVLNLCSQLLLELVALDAKEPKMLGRLRPVAEGTFPPEVLARITGSQRLSKPITSQIRVEQCAEIPTPDELWNANPTPYEKTYLNQSTGGYVLRTNTHYWILNRDQEVYTLDFRPRIVSLTPSDSNAPRQFSLHDYERVYKRKGCNVNKRMREMLTALRKRFSIVTQTNLDEARAWIVQLSYDTDMGEPGEFTGLYELGPELHRLIEAAIGLYPAGRD